MSKSASSTPKLFHGTPSDIPQSLELPQEESHAGSGRVIFATPDIMCAIAYSLKAARGRDDKAQMAGLTIYTGEKKPPIAIFGTTEGDIEEKFKNLGDGFLLEIENKDFIPFDSNAVTCEWKSTHPAQIESKHHISSDDATRFGVQVNPNSYSLIKFLSISLKDKLDVTLSLSKGDSRLEAKESPFDRLRVTSSFFANRR